MKRINIFIATIFAAQMSLGTTVANTGEPAPPMQPSYESCEKTENIQTADGLQSIVKTDFACVQRNQEKKREYDRAMATYNAQKRLIAEEKQKEMSEEQRKLAELAKQQSSIQAMKDAQKKNEKASQIYQIAGIGCGIAAGVYAGKFAASCAGGGTCNYGFLYTSIAFAGFSVLAMMQSKSHDKVANSACTSANKISSSGGTSCSGDNGSYDTSQWPNNTGITGVVDGKGNCTGSAEQCKALSDQLAGLNIKDKKGLNGFGGPGTKLPYTINADGSISTKDGKKFTVDNFKDEKSMLAMGMSPLDAKNLSNSLKQMAASEDNAKKLLDEKQDTSIAGNFDSLSGSGGAKSGSTSNNGAYTAPVEQKREVASAEGLARDYNGELIGVSSDDIFKMMNRRYNLKNKQDSFIAP